jgi:hypothetical protein
MKINTYFLRILKIACTRLNLLFWNPGSEIFTKLRYILKGESLNNDLLRPIGLHSLFRWVCFFSRPGLQVRKNLN